MKKPSIMKWRDLLDETYSAVTVNKVRSGLTILGIVIGISSVIAMVAIGTGAKGSIQASIESIGSNLLMITPGAQRGVGTQVSGGLGSSQTLTRDDADAIKQEISGIKAVSPEVSRRYQVVARGKNTNTQTVGVVPEYMTVRNVQIDLGSFISEQAIRSEAKVVVLGPTVRNTLFGEGANPIGQTVRINKIDFKVVGVTKAKGGSGFTNQDDMIFVPISTAQRLLSGSKSVSTITVQAPDQETMPVLQTSITALLLKRHAISNPQAADFTILNQADIVATASSVTGVFTTLLASIAGISLLVGGIGIMNMMLTTVTERTREIGLRKAIGGKSRDISLQFLVESVLLTLVGGVLGVVLGWLVAVAVRKFANIATEVSFTSVALAFGVSAAIGLIFGYYPARRASKLNPIQALRYE